jgi:hypothetical protein
MVPTSPPDLLRVGLRSLVVLGLVAAFGSSGGAGLAAIGGRHEAKGRVLARFGELPLVFEVNAGQTDPQVRFFSRGAGYGLFLTPAEAVFSLRRTGNRPPAVMRMRLAGARPPSRIDGVDPIAGKINYFKGHASQWRTGIAAFRKVRYAAVYPGIDLVYYGNQRHLEYDFVVAPGADPRAIRIRFEGARRPRLEANGDLVLDVDGEEVRQRRPSVYEELKSGRRSIAAAYKVNRDGSVSFELGRYDPAAPLVIDPVLVYSSFLGGSSPVILFDGDHGWDIAVDLEGSAYITGSSTSADFPTTTDSLQPTYFGGKDAFVAKVSADGSSLVYSTFLGGPEGENVFVHGGDPGIAVDAGGYVYVTGQTFANSGFPTTEGAFRRSLDREGMAVFVAKLDPTGSALVYSTYIGFGRGDAIAVDASGHAYVTGGLESADFPTRNPLQPTLTDWGAFVLKLNPAGSDLVYSTYLGGTAGLVGEPGINQDYGTAIAVDPAGHAYVGGRARSLDFPTTTNAVQPVHGGGLIDSFVAKIDRSGRFLWYSTFLGGSDRDQAEDLAVDPAGSVRVVGSTMSTNFPTVNAWQPVSGGGFDAFVARLSTGGSILLFSTYLGGASWDQGTGLALDPRGNAYVTGQTESADFPLVRPLGPSFGTGDGLDVFVTKLPFWGTEPLYSTYLGADGGESGSAIAVDASGNAYITGSVSHNGTILEPGGSSFPTVNPFQPEFGGGNDAFVSKIADDSDADCHELAGAVEVFRLGVQHVWFPIHFEWVLVRNISAGPVAAPISMVMDDLRNAAFIGFSRTSCLSPPGDPFVTVRAHPDGVLTSGELTLAGLLFWKTSPGPITYTPRMLSGVPAR